MDILEKLRHPNRCTGDEYQSLGNLCHEAANIIETLRRTLLETCKRDAARFEEIKRLKGIVAAHQLETGGCGSGAYEQIRNGSEK